MLVRFILRQENTGPGYQATVRIERSGTTGHNEEREGFLPAIPVSLDEAFRKWREGYLTSRIRSDVKFRDLSLRINPDSSSTGGNPQDNVRSLRREIQPQNRPQSMQQWLELLQEPPKVIQSIPQQQFIAYPTAIENYPLG